MDAADSHPTDTPLVRTVHRKLHARAYWMSLVFVPVLALYGGIRGKATSEPMSTVNILAVSLT